MTRFKILTLNDIAVAGLDRLPRDRYEVASEIAAGGGVAQPFTLDIACEDSIKDCAKAGLGQWVSPAQKAPDLRFFRYDPAHSTLSRHSARCRSSIP